MNTPYLYLVMRGDIPSMNPGKLAAQAAHGASMFHEVARDVKENFHDMTTGQIGADHWYLGYENWVKSAKNFGTTIVLTATKREILDLREEFEVDVLDGKLKDNLTYDRIIDPSYPFTMPKEIFEYINDGMAEVSQTLFQNVTYLENGSVFATRPEMSGFWVFGSKDELQPYLGHLKLYP